jgi:hypothetical protein
MRWTSTFPGSTRPAEGRELHRLCDWAERNTDQLAAWMAMVDTFRAANQCGCPACVAERGVNA